MSYLVLARRFRPRTFDEVVGQEAVSETLKSAITQNRVGHAYLFSGPRGVGKTSLARIFAKALNCVRGPTPEPCNECAICTDIAESRDGDVLEIDGASNNGVENVRELRENARYATTRDRFKIYIIDEVHMLSTGAFNALLKTLEEPPAHVKFIFATTEPRKLLDTILSRVQHFPFRRIGTPDIYRRLRQIAEQEHVSIQDEAIQAVARAAHGGLRDAESMLDQLSCLVGTQISEEHVRRLTGALSADRVTEFLDAMANEDTPGLLERFSVALDEGTSADAVLDEIAERLRLVMLRSTCGPQSRLLEDHAHLAESLERHAGSFTPEQLMYGIDILGRARREIRNASNARMVADVALIRIGRLRELIALEDLMECLHGGGTGRSGQPVPTQPRATARNTNPAPTPTTRRPSAPDNPPLPSPTAAQKPEVPEPDSQPSASPKAPPSIETLRERWGDLCAKYPDIVTQTALRQGRPVELNGNVLTLEYDKKHFLSSERVLQDSIRKVVERLLTEAMGVSITLRTRVVASPPNSVLPTASSDPSNAAAPAASEQPVPTAAAKPQEQQTEIKPMDEPGRAEEPADRSTQPKPDERRRSTERRPSKTAPRELDLSTQTLEEVFGRDNLHFGE